MLQRARSCKLTHNNDTGRVGITKDPVRPCETPTCRRSAIAHATSNPDPVPRYRRDNSSSGNPTNNIVECIDRREATSAITRDSCGGAHRRGDTAATSRTNEDKLTSHTTRSCTNRRSAMRAKLWELIPTVAVAEPLTPRRPCTPTKKARPGPP